MDSPEGHKPAEHRSSKGTGRAGNVSRADGRTRYGLRLTKMRRQYRWRLVGKGSRRREDRYQRPNKIELKTGREGRTVVYSEMTIDKGKNMNIL